MDSGEPSNGSEYLGIGICEVASSCKKLNTLPLTWRPDLSMRRGGVDGGAKSGSTGREEGRCLLSEYVGELLRESFCPGLEPAAFDERSPRLEMGLGEFI